MSEADLSVQSPCQSTPGSRIDAALRALRLGRPVLLLDDADRENEGDLIMAAQHVTPAAINFMAKHGRGLICVPTSSERLQQLGIERMVKQNREVFRTDFQVSVDAARGIGSGISAADRAKTIAAMASPTAVPDDLVQPGHVFPLRAKPGGVLQRAGHTEAAVDLVTLADARPIGVICEIMNDDGSMARLPELVTFAQLHGMKIGTIADLIAWRRRHDRFLERRIESDFESAWGGKFRIIVFRNTLDGAEHVALVKGRVQGDQPTLVRVHRVDFLSDFLGEAGKREGLVKRSMERLAAMEEAGVLVFVRMGMGEEIARALGGQAETQAAAEAAHPLREYGVGAQILKDLGVRRMILMSNTRPNVLPGLDGYGLTVEGWRRIDGE